YLAPGEFHLKVKKGRTTPAVIDLDPEPSNSLHRPSVDQMLLSVALAFPGTALGVVLTGMGQDGLIGAREMKKGNSQVFAQARASCVVYGMPRAIVEEHLADKILPLEDMKAQILKAVKR
ncbi:MAG: CheB methylesterase domain-containing protein, partial [Nitrospinota bacterium]|nr:CheB methylesterase domain-containing protein [Nitrospinota bacterium]